MGYVVLAHGGAGSYDSKVHDGPESAAKVGLKVLEAGGSPLDAVCAATAHLEDDERFNAGTGSNLRFDGKSIEMDASVMTSNGEFGAVACLTDVQNPVLVARHLIRTPQDILVGTGAQMYARQQGHGPHDVRTQGAQDRYDTLMGLLRQGKAPAGWVDWEIPELAKHWNFETPLRDIIGPTDTVGAVATDGETFAAALSTGGTICTLLGRVGDVPLPGCGLRAGTAGAVCVTGDGEHLARKRLADRVYEWLEAGETPQAALDKGIALFPDHVAVGILVMNKDNAVGGSNLQMAWAEASA